MALTSSWSLVAGSRSLWSRVSVKSASSTRVFSPSRGVRCAAGASGRVVQHTVEPGESLYRIASTHGVTVEELLLENPHVDAAKLRPGTVLVIDDGVHYRFSQEEVKAAASKGGVRTAVGRFVNSIQIPGPSRPTSAGQQPWGTILAVAAGALAYILANQLGRKERAEPQETGLEARDEGRNVDNSQAPADAAVVAVLREAKEHISELQSALAAKEEQWQHMLARARSDHEERQLLKARLELLEQELAAAKQRSKTR
ncbi:LysM domain containing protein [Klebsormidium nitens]|uniref:LysM domain containing protein n=1 Tax=Klebsormidium nitens TaxID=105231 RepID=A0A1Y1ILW6_KLENI|nr:LysM domain containing protein [Klebsormidium nitens]|eukprot:GAQ91850.1 LysM domain containing protein [Klebsormidium nitens]